jgi:hypothetical protein
MDEPKISHKGDKRFFNFLNTQSVSPLEVLSIVGLFVVFLLLNLATASRYVTLWHDEVWFTDPAANLYLGNGFTSSAWPVQTKDEFWAGNAPLYTILLSNWMQLFGFSIVSVRALNYVLMIVAALLLWVAAVRLNLFTSRWSRITFILLLLLGQGMFFNYRTGRYDCLGMILLATGLLAYSLQAIWLRCILLSFMGIFLPMTGLQLVAYILILGTLLQLYWGKLGLSLRREYLSVACGFGVGAIFLYLLYYTNGVGLKFLRATAASGESITGQVAKCVLRGNCEGIARFLELPYIFIQDKSFLLLIILGIAIAAYQKSKGTFSLGRPSRLEFGLLVSVCIPLGMFFLSKFSIYYTWMAYIPLAICVLSTIDASQLNRKRMISSLITGVLVLVCLVGLPLRFVGIVRHWNVMDYAQIEALVDRNVTQSDWLLCDLKVYYAAKKKAGVVILPTYTGSADFKTIPEREKISVLILKPGIIENKEHELTQRLGGQWKPTGDGISPSEEYVFKVYRRDS